MLGQHLPRVALAACHWPRQMSRADETTGAAAPWTEPSCSNKAVDLVIHRLQYAASVVNATGARPGSGFVHCELQLAPPDIGRHVA